MNAHKLRFVLTIGFIAAFAFIFSISSAAADKPELRAPYLLDLRTVDKEFFKRFAADARIKIGDRRGFYLQVKLDGDALAELDKNGAILASSHDWSKLPPGVLPPASGYTSDDIISGLYNLAGQYPALCKYATLGTSVNGKKLAGLRMTGNGAAARGKVELRILGAHHGNEITAGTVPYLIAQKLLEDYAAGDSNIKYLLNNSSILIVPLVNPDGRDLNQRENANGSDLNREYGYHYQATETNTKPFNEPEVLAVAKDHLSRAYSMSFSFHNYGDIVNYVWNYSGTRCLDDALVSSVADAYGHTANYSVTEGFDWYQTYGDTNDYSYGVSGDFDYTIEIAEETDAALSTTFSINYAAVVEAFTRQISEGVHIQVLDDATNAPLPAVAKFFDASTGAHKSHSAYAGADGYIGRLLPVGKYKILIYSDGYDPYELSVDASSSALSSGIAQTARLVKSAVAQSCAYKIAAVIAADASTDYPFDALAAPDGRSCRLSKKGTITLAFKDACKTSLKIYAGSDETGSVKVYGLAALGGTETYLATLTANGEITLSSAYSLFKIADNGNAANAIMGFALDAVTCAAPPAPEEEESAAEEEAELADGDMEAEEEISPELEPDPEPIEEELAAETDPDEPELSEIEEETADVIDEPVEADEAVEEDAIYDDETDEIEAPGEDETPELADNAEEFEAEDDGAKNNETETADYVEYDYVDWGELAEWYDQPEEEPDLLYEAENAKRGSSSSGCANSSDGIYITAALALLAIGRLRRARL